jgi:hypothetical protein
MMAVPASAMTRYQYAPLDTASQEIRLVELQPGAIDDPVRIAVLTTAFKIPASPREKISVEKVRLGLRDGWIVFENLEGRFYFDHAAKEATWDHPNPPPDWKYYGDDDYYFKLVEPAYEALSYVWGGNADETMIEVVPSQSDGWSYNTVPWKTAGLPIQRNLHDALRQLRDPNTTRLLWVDAICIDQKNDNEKNQQIMRMADIYKYAQRVIVWLGGATSDSSMALRILGHIGNQIEFSRDWSIAPAPGCTEPKWCRLDDAAVIDERPETWDAVLGLLTRPWFDRLWVKQEIQLANPSAVIQCGADTIKWQQLRRAILACSLLRMPKGTSPLLKPRIDTVSILALNMHGGDPLELLENAISAECKDSRDRIFGILGLLPDVISRKIQPCYTQLPQEVHRDALLLYLECTGKLDVLSLVGPSWIPHWTTPQRKLELRGTFCTGNSTAEASYVAPDVLMASGVTWDSVEAVVGPLPDDRTQVLAIVNDFWLTAKSTTETYPNGDTLVQACTWTLWLGLLQDRWENVAGDSPWFSQAQIPFQQISEGIVKPPAELDWFVQSRWSDCFFFRTRKGYFGITTKDVMVGDKLSVLLGCSSPTIIREQPNGKHLFIGCAYVHGIMDGEVLLGPLPASYKVTVQRGESIVRYFFHNQVTQKKFDKDPRLGRLPGDWKRIRAGHRLWPSRTVDAFQNTTTGEILHSDPRLLPEALRARGVKLEIFSLI